MTAVDDLAAWLTQIWDEDEVMAKAASPGPWRRRAHLGGEVIAAGGWDVGGSDIADSDIKHIARHDPGAVLARIAADRQILAEYVTRDQDVDLMLGPDCKRRGQWSGLRLAVRILASAYADRPGYQEAWRPA